MLNRPRLLALVAIALFGSAIAINQWSTYVADAKTALNADESAVLAEKLLKSRMSYGAVDQSVLKVDPTQQLTLQARVDSNAAGSLLASSSVRSTAGSADLKSTKSKAATAASDLVAETLTSQSSALTGMRGQMTRWERFEFDREAAIANVAPIGMVASGFAGGSGYASWALSSGATSGGGMSRAFDRPTSLEQSVSSLSNLVSANSAETPAPAKADTNDTTPVITGPVQNSNHAVPEPGNWSLMAIGLLMLLFWRQKQFAIRTR